MLLKYTLLIPGKSPLRLVHGWPLRENRVEREFRKMTSPSSCTRAASALPKPLLIRLFVPEPLGDGVSPASPKSLISVLSYPFDYISKCITFYSQEPEAKRN